jgi:hypothetical protein
MIFLYTKNGIMMSRFRTRISTVLERADGLRRIEHLAIAMSFRNKSRNPPRRSGTPPMEGILKAPLFGGVAAGRGGLRRIAEWNPEPVAQNRKCGMKEIVFKSMDILRSLNEKPGKTTEPGTPAEDRMTGAVLAASDGRAGF